MGVSTIAKIPSNPSIKEFEKVIKLIDNNGYIVESKYNKKDEEQPIFHSVLSYKYKKEIQNKNIFMIKNHIDDKQEFLIEEYGEDIYNKDGYRIFQPFLYLSANGSELSIDLFTKILKYFGGYLIQYDSKTIDEEDYIIYIKKEFSIPEPIPKEVKNKFQNINSNNINNDINFGF